MSYNVRQLQPQAWEIEEQGVRCFLFEGDDCAMLVDTGFGSGDLAGLVKTLTDRPVFVVNTHADIDHIGCNSQFERIYMHPAEFDRYTRSRGGGDCSQLLPLWQGERIAVGERVFEVHLIPGHTPGSIALLDRTNRILISGDSVQQGGIYMFGEGRNLPAYLHSMRYLYRLSSEFDLVYPSHGPMPVQANAVQKLACVAEELLQNRNQFTSVESPRGLPCCEYDCGVARFLL